MKEELISKLYDVVNNIGDKSELSKISEILTELRSADFSEADMESVSEVFGYDPTVDEYLNEYFVLGDEQSLPDLEDYLSESLFAFDKESIEHLEKTEDKKNNMKDIASNAEIKDVDVSEDGVLKAIIEIPAADAAKILTEVDSSEELGSDIADELISLIVSQKPDVELSPKLKPVSGKIIKIIKSSDEIDPNRYSFSKMKTHNKYAIKFSQALEDKVVEELAEEQVAEEAAAAEEEKEAVEKAAQVPTEQIKAMEQAEALNNADPSILTEELKPTGIPVKSSLVEANSTLPKIEDVVAANAVAPSSYVDSSIAEYADTKEVQALDEMTDALISVGPEAASEALGLMAENVDFSTAEIIQSEVLKKIEPALFSSFADKSWISDCELFSCYNVLRAYLGNKVKSFASQEGVNSKKVFQNNFSMAGVLMKRNESKKNKNFSKTTLGERALRSINLKNSYAHKLSNGLLEDAETRRNLAKIYKKSNISAAEIELLKAQRAVESGEKRLDLEKRLVRARDEYDKLLDQADELLADKVVPEAVDAGISAGEKRAMLHAAIKNATIGGLGIGGGYLAHDVVSSRNEPLPGFSDDFGADEFEFSNSSSMDDVQAINAGSEIEGVPARNLKEEEAEITEKALDKGLEEQEKQSDAIIQQSILEDEAKDVIDEASPEETMKAIVEVLKEESPEVAAAVLTEIADRVGVETAVAIQAEIGKDVSEEAAKVAEDATVKVEDVDAAAEIVKEASENGIDEKNFSDAKMKAYNFFCHNFSDIIEGAIEKAKEEKAEELLKDVEVSEEDDGTMEKVVEGIKELPTIKDSADCLAQIDEECGPEVAVAIQSELLKDDSEFFKKVNEEAMIAVDAVAKALKIVEEFKSGDKPESFSSVEQTGKWKKYVVSFADALPQKEKDKLIAEVKEQILKEIGAGEEETEEEKQEEAAPAVVPEGLPVPPVPEPGIVPPQEAAPAPEVLQAAAAAQGIPPEVAAQAIAAQAVPQPQVPVPPGIGPGMSQIPVNVIEQGYAPIQQPTATSLPDTSGLMSYDFQPSFDALVPPQPRAVTNSLLTAGEQANPGIDNLPPLPLMQPEAPVLTSTTGAFVPGENQAPAYVHVLPTPEAASPVVAAQQTVIPPQTSMGMGMPQPAPMTEDAIARKAIMESFSKAKSPMYFSAGQKGSAKEEYQKIMGIL